MLYINYPMIESYQHINSVNDNDYIDRKIPVTLHPGNKYKSLVRNSFMNINVSHINRLYDLLENKYGIEKIILR